MSRAAACEANRCSWVGGGGQNDLHSGSSRGIRGAHGAWGRAPAQPPSVELSWGWRHGCYTGSSKVVGLFITFELFIWGFSSSSGLFRCWQSCQVYSCQPLQINSQLSPAFDVGNQRNYVYCFFFFFQGSDAEVFRTSERVDRTVALNPCELMDRWRSWL